MNPTILPVRDSDNPPLTVPRWLAGLVLRWRLAVVVGVATAALAPLSLVVIPPVYRATSTFIANPTSAASLGGSLGGLGANLVSQLGINPTSDPAQSPAFYEELLRSRELQTRLLLSRFADPRAIPGADSATFLEILNVKGADQQVRLERAIRRLNRDLRGTAFQKTNLVRVEANTRWPELSAAVANRAVELVSTFNREQRTSTAASRRAYLEERLTEARMDLQGAEQTLRSFYVQNRQWRTSPNLTFAEQQLRRRVDLAEELHFTLQRQYEVARLDELNSAALITVVDSAVVPRKAQWPRYGILLAATLFVSVFAGLVVAGFASVWDDWRGRDPDSVRTFRDAFSRARADIGATLRGKRRLRAPRSERVA